MSTKDLSRTVVEGGRYFRNRDDRRQSHRDERAIERAYLRDVRLDPDLADARVPERAQRVGRGSRDKLSPAERWLATHVGRPWREVEGEIFATFDTRTLMGRHVVIDHLLPWRWTPRGWPLGAWRVHRRGFVVDARGILRFAGPLWTRPRVEHSASDAVVSQLGERRVAVHGERLYWREPTGRVGRDAKLAYRQTHELSDDERAWWASLCDCERVYACTPAEPATTRR
ncbi:hypothetical protein [Sandaracinus amylolyticus]|uniref:hypothetical protein n=1 Tax=Sandaracinus amylolyticus TaxID=927083 RepID=UPI001F396463|nr:hypothetical protein [Sandaracinus amylolyticus]UJR83280.1 Hypothetical protein I5071_53480 [Sandaracinus amylolyticus]